jgi:hypothetical protein
MQEDQHDEQIFIKKHQLRILGDSNPQVEKNFTSA